MLISPIILAATPEELETQFNKVIHLGNRISIDISDGIYAPHKTVTLIEALAFLEKHKEETKSKVFDFDLMVQNWETLILLLTEAMQFVNVNVVVVHKNVFKKIPTAFKLGIALDVENGVNIEELKDLPAVQLMMIHLGFQGTAFLPQNVKKIAELRQQNYGGEIIIDGGVTIETIHYFLPPHSQPDILGVGSFFTRAENPLEHLKLLEDAIRNNP